jgi:hypothetical protein
MRCSSCTTCTMNYTCSFCTWKQDRKLRDKRRLLLFCGTRAVVLQWCILGRKLGTIRCRMATDDERKHGTFRRCLSRRDPHCRKGTRPRLPNTSALPRDRAKCAPCTVKQGDLHCCTHDLNLVLETDHLVLHVEHKDYYNCDTDDCEQRKQVEVDCEERITAS